MQVLQFEYSLQELLPLEVVPCIARKNLLLFLFCRTKVRA